jgi:hypothetical protein
MRQVAAQRGDDDDRQRHQLALAPALAPNPRRAPREVRFLEVQPAELGHAQSEAEERHDDRVLARLCLRVAGGRVEHPADVFDGGPARVAAAFGPDAGHLEIPAAMHDAEHPGELRDRPECGERPVDARRREVRVEHRGAEAQNDPVRAGAVLAEQPIERRFDRERRRDAEARREKPGERLEVVLVAPHRVRRFAGAPGLEDALRGVPAPAGQQQHGRQDLGRDESQGGRHRAPPTSRIPTASPR